MFIRTITIWPRPVSYTHLICGSIIDAFGFVPNQIQTDSAVFGIKLSASLIPAFTFFIGVCALFFYPISKKMNERIQAELEERRKNIL